MNNLEGIINKYKLQNNKDKTYSKFNFNINIMQNITRLKII